MAKLRTNPISKADIKEYLATQDDLALEMRSVALCRAKGWSVAHGGTYTDPVTKKMRQFDIRALSTEEALRAYLAIECKALSPSFPLLISRLPRSKSESYHQVIISSERFGLIEELPGCRSRVIHLDPFHSAYQSGEPVGKHTTQVGRSSQNEIVSGDAESFDKWSQAVASASDLVSDACSAHKAVATGYMFSVVIPVLVVPDGTLWTVDYSSEGRMWDGPKKTEATEFYLGREYRVGAFGYNFSHLHVVTSSGLETFLSRFGGNALGEWFPRAPLEKAANQMQ